MYLQHFQFTSEPFSIAPDPRFLFLSVRHEEALAHLLYGLREGGGFVALTGEVGTGKTTLCHCLMEHLPDSVDLALVLNPKLSSLELIATICDELGLKYPDNNTSIKVITDVLNRYLLDAHAKGRRTVVLIDEAQNLSLDVLEQIRLLTNLETKQTKLLQIILVGQPELNNLLNCEELRQLSQRITGRYHLVPLNFSETKDYIRHRLSKVAGRSDVFSVGALRTIYRRSKGIPRLINTIADRSLLGAFSKNQYQVSTGLVTHAANEILNVGKRFQWQALLAGLILGAMLVALGWYVWSSVTQQHAQIQQPVIEVEPIVKKRPVIAKPVPPLVPKPQLLTQKLEQQTLSLPQAFSRLFSLYGLNLDVNQTSNPCDVAKQQGYACLIDNGNWREILQFDRPAILELESANRKKFHVVITKVADNQIQLGLGNNQTFNTELTQLVLLWNGSYVQLWKPPGIGKYLLREGDQSDKVRRLRKLLISFDQDITETPSPGLFDDTLTDSVIRFQKASGLKADGVVGPKTWILLRNATDNERPRLMIEGN